MIRFIKTFLFLAFSATLVWCGGLLCFVGEIPSEPAQDESHTDAIVVLTGGTGRVEHGIALLAEKKAEKLFISGVSAGVKVQELLAAAGQENRRFRRLEQNITLGFEAEDTKGNATETAAWIEQQGYNSLRLVTSNYHMPRSVMELRFTLPKVRIIPDPVFPEQFKRDHWWKFPGSTQLIITEYHKFAASYLQHMYEKLT